MSKHTGLLQLFLVQDLHDSGLVRDGRNELVVDDRNRVILHARLDDKVGNTSSIGERRDITTDLVEGEREVTAKGTGELSLGLIADDHDGRVGGGTGLTTGDDATGGF